MKQMPKKNSLRSRAPAHVKKLLAQTYARILTPEGDEYYSAEILEFPGCSAQGSSPAEAYANLERAAEVWLGDWLAQGKEAPRPFMNTATSGRFALRLPTGLYVRASQAAARERVSLNQYIANAVAERVGASTTLSVVGGLVGGAVGEVRKLRSVGSGQHARERAAV
jgi:predicted RNase H-like HicB family nuclease